MITVDAASTIAEAVAIRDGRFVAVGTSADIRRLVGDGTRVIDAGGRTVIPGLIDSHVHALGVAAAEDAQPFQNLKSIAEMQAWVRHAASAAPAGDWIWTPRVFPTRIREQRFPTRAELDAAAPNHPVVVDGAYALMVNSAALRAASSTPARRTLRAAPSSRAPMAARQACCATWARCSRDSAAASDERRRRSTRSSACTRAYNRVGITSVGERGASVAGSGCTRRCARRAACTCARP